MALDLHRAALGLDCSELGAVVRRETGLNGHIVSLGTLGPVTLVPGRSAAFGLGRVSAPGDAKSIYDLLYTHDLVSIAGDASGGSLSLSGASVGICSLAIEQARVTKTVPRISAVAPIDGVHRHIAEAEWMMRVERHACGLFPTTTLAASSHNSIVISSEWIPAHTFGEWLLQTPRAEKTILTRVQKIFGRLSDDLYSWRDPGAVPSSENYAEKVQRRKRLLLRDARIGTVVECLFTRGAVVNDQLCRPIDTLLRLFARHSPPARAVTGHTCHGDLIPEDVLVDRDGGLLALIDPNPQVQSPLFDYGKMIMSFGIAYDLAIRDYVSAQVVSTASDSVIHVETAVQKPWGSVVTLHERVALALAEDLHRTTWCRVHAPRVSPHWLVALAGLQAIGIASFHLSHHRRPARALYFLAQGVTLMERGLRALDRA